MGQGDRMTVANKILNSLANAAALNLQAVTLVQGAVLHPAGERIRHVYFPTSGMISLLAVTTSGDQIETAVVGRDGVVGASIGAFGKNAIGQATVQVAGTALRMNGTDFLASFNDSEPFRTAINSYLTVILVQIQQSAACHALHSVDARLGRWLLQSRDAVESDEIKLTQEFLSQMLGVQRAAVSIAASAMQTAGLIRYSRGTIQILKRGGIQQRSCECYDTVRQSGDTFLKGLRQKPK
jgi:CRP-like cAMP-binding protein